MGKTAKYRILRSYGITEEAYQARKAAQTFCCYICGKPEAKGRYGLALDHDHNTGALRKFLCNQCNMLVGIHENNPYLLANVCAYVQENTE